MRSLRLLSLVALVGILAFPPSASAILLTAFRDARLTGSADDSSPKTAVDAAGHAHVAWLRGGSSNPGIYYATDASGSWKVIRVSTRPDDAVQAISVDAAGKAHILYVRSVDGPLPGLFYLTNRTGTWRGALLTRAALAGTLRADPSGTVRIAYVPFSAANSHGLSYATNASGAWQVIGITALFTGSIHDIRVDTAGRVRILFYHPEWSGQAASGTYELVRTGTTNAMRRLMAGFFESASIDAQGRYHGTRNDSSGLEYWTNRTGSWHMIKPVTSPVLRSRIVAAPDGTVRIAYVDPAFSGSHALRYLSNRYFYWLGGVMDYGDFGESAVSIGVGPDGEGVTGYQRGGPTAPGILVTTPADVPPAVIAKTPASNATADPTTTISVRFSEPVTGISDQTFQVRNENDSHALVVGTFSYNPATRVATIDPAGPSLPSGTRYRVHLLAGITDQTGNALPPQSWYFTTSGQDVVAPRITSRFPAPEATDVPTDLTRISFGVNEPISGVATSTFYLEDATTNALISTGPIGSGVVWYRNLQQALAPSTLYRVVLTMGISDGAGNPLSAESWTFTTAATP